MAFITAFIGIKLVNPFILEKKLGAYVSSLVRGDNPQNPGKEINQTWRVGVFPHPTTGRGGGTRVFQEYRSKYKLGTKTGWIPGSHTGMGAPRRPE